MLYLPSYSFLVRLYIQHVNLWTIFCFREGAKGGKNHNAKQVKNKTKQKNPHAIGFPFIAMPLTFMGNQLSSKKLVSGMFWFSSENWADELNVSHPKNQNILVLLTLIPFSIYIALESHTTT